MKYDVTPYNSYKMIKCVSVCVRYCVRIWEKIYLPTSPALTKSELTLRQGTEAAVFSILGASTMMIGDPISSALESFCVSPISADGSFDSDTILPAKL